MKTVLCYGDSNTWGYLAPGGRAPGQVGALAGRPPAGARGRRPRRGDGPERADDRVRRARGSGSKRPGPLPAMLETHAPVDVLVLFLGVNDFFLPFQVTAWRVAHAVGALVDAARGSKWGPDGGPPAVVALRPPPFGDLGAERA